MGFDINGLAPKNEKGKYFRNNVWYWRPLWDFIYSFAPDILSAQDYERGQYNDFHKIDERTAEKLAERLDVLVGQGIAKMYIDKRNNQLNKLPLEPCGLCEGTGRRRDRIAQINGIIVCNGCNGAGKRSDSRTHYPLDEDNIKSFSEFVRASGGFEIG